MNTARCLLAGSTLLASAGALQAEEFRATTWLPATNVLTENFFTKWFEDVAEMTGGEITFQLFPSSSLVPAQAITQGVADGIAQVGYHTASYTPTDNPVSQSLSSMGFINSDPFVLAFAYADYVMNDPQGYEDWHDDGVVPVGGFSSPVIHLICRGEPVRTLADLDGKRVRLPGGSIAAFVEAMGATNVSIPATEAYAAFEYGNIDCTANDATWLVGQTNFVEVADSVTFVPITPLFTSPSYVYDIEFWADRTPEQRRMLLDASARAMANLQIAYDVSVAEGIAAAQEKGLELIEPDETLETFRTEWIEAGAGDMLGVAANTYGIADPEAMFATFTGYLDKWDELVAGIADRGNADELTALLKANLFDQIDVETYGLD